MSTERDKALAVAAITYNWNDEDRQRNSPNAALVDSVATALATRAKEAEEAAWRQAVSIVRSLACSENYTGHWRAGYSHAQGDAEEALEAGARKVEGR